MLFIHHRDNLQTNVILLFYMDKVPQQSHDPEKWLLEAKYIHQILNSNTHWKWISAITIFKEYSRWSYHHRNYV